MGYRSGEALRSAVKAGGARVANALERVVSQRFVNRLAEQMNDDVVVKGGQAMTARFGPEARATFDIDIAIRAGSCDEALAKLAEAASERSADEDHLRFEQTKVKKSTTPGLASARFQVYLANRRHNQISVDLMAQDSLEGITERIPVTPLVNLPQQQWSQTWPVLTTHEHVAEKLARIYTRFSSGGSSAARDVVDLALLARSGQVDPDQLAHSLRRAQRRPLSGGSHLQLPEGFEEPVEHRAAVEAAGHDWREAMQAISGIADPALRAVHGLPRENDQAPGGGAHRAAGQDPGGSGMTWVQPHVRNGTQVAGHWRRPRGG